MSGLAPSKTTNLHGVWICGGFLGVRCIECDHRAVLEQEQLPAIRSGNMTELYSLKLRCQGCGRAGQGKAFWEMCTPFDREEAELFLRGRDIKKPVVLHR